MVSRQSTIKTSLLVFYPLYKGMWGFHHESRKLLKKFKRDRDFDAKKGGMARLTGQNRRDGGIWEPYCGPSITTGTTWNSESPERFKWSWNLNYFYLKMNEGDIVHLNVTTGFLGFSNEIISPTQKGMIWYRCAFVTIISSWVLK